MNIRNYNIFFHTHTISGIIISAILYVIFFAGSFAFFRDEIAAWQNNTSFKNFKQDHRTYDQLIDSLQGEYNLHGRDITFYMHHGGAASYVSLSASNDTLLNKENLAKLKEDKNAPKTKGRRGRRGGEDSKNFTYDFVNKQPGEYTKNYDMGEFLFRLHFLAQLNQVPIRVGIAPFGYFIAGLTAFLFLFALITGLMLHWDKIVSNFFIFRPFNKWKTVWTDMHTALGVIGFPFQFIFAVTGIFLIINSVLTIPFSKLLYDGNQEKMYQDLGNAGAAIYPYAYKPLDTPIRLANYLDLAKEKWPESEFTRIVMKNYGDSNMHIILETEPHYSKSFAGSGYIDIRVSDQKIIAQKSPIQNASYSDKVKSLLYRLHYGDYGGYPLKAIYFILGIMGCLVITSGILIWLVARDKNNVIPRKRKFNFWMANFFMAICLTLLPVTALTFIALKFGTTVDQKFIYTIFFYSWLILTLYYTFRKSINRTNRETLLLGSVLAFFVPIANGWKSNAWIWNSFQQGKTDILLIDLLWLCIAIIGLLAYIKTKKFFRKVA
ncbi:PepSY domain-containing protein [Sphingobacterium sp. SRCM116780]|uniref:PepSY-associated TM helix domain-containing protein n=1 Tax=Sphingobacterium sp. SRCM116780 TaxID=2907623 RepID=UPI001F1DC029|nr:PepSY-associated TM helix domain-containing protein [Sphingobacterium sp. SRCM116780]UIR55982.1 PepSY domain-containing protein [Sphingobacterium sp. SRCM116780]